MNSNNVIESMCQLLLLTVLQEKTLRCSGPVFVVCPPVPYWELYQ